MPEASPEQTVQPPARPTLRARIVYTSNILVPAALASLLLRVTVSDRVVPLNWNLYPPLLGLALLGTASLLLSSYQRWLKAVLALPMIILLTWSLHREQPLLFRGLPARTAPVDGATPIRLMTWNVFIFTWGTAGIEETIRAQKPDVLAIVEGTTDEPLARATFEAALPGYHYAASPRNQLYILSRYPISDTWENADESNARLFRVRLDTPDGPVHLLTLHLRGPWQRSESAAFAELRAAMEAVDGPLIVTGDFNTPRGSARLAAVSQGFDDAYLTASRSRYLATWPSIPAPLWQIDHTFTRGLQLLDAARLPTSESDHQAQLLTLQRSDRRACTSKPAGHVIERCGYPSSS